MNSQEKNKNQTSNNKPRKKKSPRTSSDYSTHIYALGGLDEVGKNMYCFESPGELVVVDAGQKFTEKGNLAADAMIPNIHFLKKNEKKLAGIFITHGHEDHIGAIPHILRHVKIPRIYTTPIAKDLMMNKLRMAKVNVDPKIFFIVDINKPIKTKDFEITPFYVNHSIPEALGYKIKDKNGTILVTGDFKFDLTPPGEKASYDLITKWGKEGVDLLMSDSTNSKIKGFSKSEKEIGEEIKKLISGTNNRVIISTFASNMYRVRQIILAARESKKKVCVVGRSMINAIEILIQRGHIEKGDWLISDRGIKYEDPKKVVILCTGSQGESLAALTRIAEGRHNTIKIQEGDSVIFSSSPIPGNTYFVNQLSNLIVKQGARAIENSVIESIHASGHGYELEQKLMHNLVNPNYFFPVHGNTNMLMKHKETGIACGVKEQNIFVLNNGDVLKMKKSKISRNFKRVIPAGFIFVHNNSGALLENNSEIESSKMTSDGVASIQLVINKSFAEINALEISFRGCINTRGAETIHKLKKTIKSRIDEFSKNEHKHINELKDELRVEVERKLFHDLQIEPLVIVSITRT